MHARMRGVTFTFSFHCSGQEAAQPNPDAKPGKASLITAPNVRKMAPVFLGVSMKKCQYRDCIALKNRNTEKMQMKLSFFYIIKQKSIIVSFEAEYPYKKVYIHIFFFIIL